MRASLNYRRMMSSVTALDDNYLIVTGGLNPSGYRTEYYSIEDDSWKTIADLNISRKAHSSCSFNQSQVFVFGGKNGSNQTINTIERLQFRNLDLGWTEILIESDLKPPLQSYPAVCQINSNEICILTKSDKSNQGAYLFNLRESTVKRMERQKSAIKLLAKQMPTVMTPCGVLITCDRDNLNMYQFSHSGWIAPTGIQLNDGD